MPAASLPSTGMGDDGGKKDDFGDAFDAKAFEALERDFQEVRAGAKP